MGKNSDMLSAHDSLAIGYAAKICDGYDVANLLVSLKKSDVLEIEGKTIIGSLPSLNPDELNKLYFSEINAHGKRVMLVDCFFENKSLKDGFSLACEALGVKVDFLETNSELSLIDESSCRYERLVCD